MYTLVLLRHGQTAFNKDKMFGGWTDVPLTEQGIEEAENAGKNLEAAGYEFDVAFTSLLNRAQETLRLAFSQMKSSSIPIHYSWRLNERHYGALQGQKHEEIAKIHSPEQVHIWRRSFNVPPPPLAHDDPRHPRHDAKYAHIDPKDLPHGESLQDTIKRVMPYWEGEIVPQIMADKKVIVVASNNSLRALIKHINKISDDDIVRLEIKNGTPIIFTLDEDLNPIDKYYLLDGGIKEPVELKK